MPPEVPMRLGHRIKCFSLVIFFVALALRLSIAWRSGFFTTFQHDEMVRIALSVLKYHEYGNPYLVRTGPTAHEMPLYPLFLSLIRSEEHTSELQSLRHLVCR